MRPVGVALSERIDASCVESNDDDDEDENDVAHAHGDAFPGDTEDRSRPSRLPARVSIIQPPTKVFKIIHWEISSFSSADVFVDRARSSGAGMLPSQATSIEMLW